MKKMLYCMIILTFALLCAVPAYAEETSVETVPGSTDIPVYAKYVDNTDFTSVPVDENGSGSITLPDGTKITVSGADTAMGRLIVEKVTDGNILDWIRKKLGGKTTDTAVYAVYYIDGNGSMHTANGVEITVQLQDGSAYSVYAISDGKTEKLDASVQDGAVTFVTNGTQFYALCKDAKATPNGSSSPKTGDAFRPAPWALLCIGSISALAIIRKKRKLGTGKSKI